MPADVRNASVLNSIMERYRECSGQTINLNKSSIVFSANVPEQKIREMVSPMKVKEVDNCGTYLGIPSFEVSPEVPQWDISKTELCRN